MNSTENIRPSLQRNEINRRMTADPAAFVTEECARYRQNVAEVENWLNDAAVKRRVLLLAGPSSSGKTTTANLLCESLRRDGVDAFVVSLDDFYRGRGLAPLLPDGSYDYESPEATCRSSRNVSVRCWMRDTPCFRNTILKRACRRRKKYR